MPSWRFCSNSKGSALSPGYKEILGDGWEPRVLNPGIMTCHRPLPVRLLGNKCAGWWGGRDRGQGLWTQMLEGRAETSSHGELLCLSPEPQGRGDQSFPALSFPSPSLNLDLHLSKKWSCGWCNILKRDHSLVQPLKGGFMDKEEGSQASASLSCQKLSLGKNVYWITSEFISCHWH